MFSMLNKEIPHKDTATRIYGILLTHIRLSVFYRDYGVPDTIDGRFDLLCLHMFMVMHRLEDSEQSTALKQALFDVCFADMDQMLREMGVGDMGVPKRMRRMMEAFNGRMHVYKDVFNDKLALTNAIARNIYDQESPGQAAALAEYAHQQFIIFQKQSLDEIYRGGLIMGDAFTEAEEGQ